MVRSTPSSGSMRTIINRLCIATAALLLAAVTTYVTADPLAPQCFSAVYDYGRQSVPILPVTRDPATNDPFDNSLQYLTRGSYPVTGSVATFTGYEMVDTETIIVTRDSNNKFDLLLVHDQNNTDTDGFDFYLQVTVGTSCTNGVCTGLLGNNTIVAAAFQNTPYLTGTGLPTQACALSPTVSYDQVAANFSRGQCCAATGSCCGATQVCGQFDECVGAGTFYVNKQINPSAPSTANAALWLGHLPVAPVATDYCITLEYTHLPSTSPGIKQIQFVNALLGGAAQQLTVPRATAGNTISICSTTCTAPNAGVDPVVTATAFCNAKTTCGACNAVDPSNPNTPACGWCSSGTNTGTCVPSSAQCANTFDNTCSTISCPATTDCNTCSTAPAGCGICLDASGGPACVPGNKLTGLASGTCQRWHFENGLGAVCPATLPPPLPPGVLPGAAPTPQLFTLYSSNFQSNLIGWSVKDVTIGHDIQSPVFSQWTVSDGLLIQTSDIRTTPLSSAGSAGTWFYYVPGLDSYWVSYSVTAQMRSQGENYMSIAVRYIDPNNYYELEWADANPLPKACLDKPSYTLGIPSVVLRTLRLKKVVGPGGNTPPTTTILATKKVGYDTQTTYNVQIIVFESFITAPLAADATEIVVFINNVHQWTVTDIATDRPLYGTVAASTAGEANARFNNFVVSMVTVPLPVPSTIQAKGPYWSYYQFLFNPFTYSNNTNGFVFTVQLYTNEPMSDDVRTDLGGLSVPQYSVAGIEMYLHYGGGSSSQASLPTPSNYRASAKPSAIGETSLTMSVPSAAFLGQSGPWYVGVFNRNWRGGTRTVQRFSLVSAVTPVTSVQLGNPNPLIGQLSAVNMYSVPLTTLSGFIKFQVTRGDAGNPTTAGTNITVFVSIAGTTGSGFPPSPSLDTTFDFSDDHKGNQDNINTISDPIAHSIQVPNPALGTYYVSVYARSAAAGPSLVPPSLAVPFNLTISVPNPSISSIIPVQASTDGGSPLTIIGSDFGSTGTVTVDGNNCPISTTDYTATQITCSLPPGQGQFRNVIVTTSGVSSIPTPAVSFSYLPPLIQAISPFNSPTTANFSVTLTGQNFGGSASTVAVTIGGKSCPIATGAVFPRGTIICTLPPGQGASVPIDFRVAGQPTAAGSVTTFAYDPPVITSVFPPNGPTAYTNLTITGKNFGSQAFGSVISATASYVLVGGMICDFNAASGPAITATSVGHNRVVCRAPLGVGRKNTVIVVVAGQTSNIQLFDYDAPIVTSVVPANGPTTGRNITLNGRNFGSGDVTDFSVSLYNVATTINTACTNPVHISDSQISCLAPAGTGVSLVAQATVASQDAATSGTALFSYDAPIVGNNGVQPQNGAAAGGIIISVAGTNFGPAPVAGKLFVPVSVSVNGAACNVLTSNHTFITCTLPAGTGSNVPVVVTVDGQSSTTNGVYTYAVPTVSSVLPNSGSTLGGTVVTVFGSNFGPTSAVGTVRLGPNACTVASPFQWTDTQIVCTLPVGQGRVNTVVTVNSVSSVSNVPFSYGQPNITFAGPLNSPTIGSLDSNPLNHVTLTINGADFGALTGNVTIGTRSSCAVTSWTATTVLCTVGPGEGTNLVITVNSAANGGSFSTCCFAYDAPVITSYWPPVVPTTNTTVTVLGYNFGARDLAGSAGYTGIIQPACYTVDEMDTTSTVVNGLSGWTYTYDTNAYSNGFIFNDGTGAQTGVQSVVFTADQLPYTGLWRVSFVTTARAFKSAPCNAVPVTLTTGYGLPISTTADLSGAGVIGTGDYQLSAGSVRVTLNTSGTTNCVTYVDALRFCPVPYPAAQLPFTTTRVLQHNHTALVIDVPAGVGIENTFSFALGAIAATTLQSVTTTTTNATLSFARAAPVVISGPSCAGGCSVNGGNTITFGGTGFGPNPAAIVVWIGQLASNATLCRSVAITTPDQTFTCVTSAWPLGGSGAPVTVWVQVGGQMTTTSVSFAVHSITANSVGTVCGTPSKVLSATRGGQSVCIGMTNLPAGASISNTQVLYGIATGSYCASTGSANCVPGWWFNCSVTAVNPGPGTVVCTTPEGAGVNLLIKVAVNGVWSALSTSTDTISYPAPRFIDATIRANVGDPRGNRTFVDPSTQGNWVTQDGYDFPTSSALWDIIQINYANPTSSYPCESIEVYSPFGAAFGYSYTPPTDPLTRVAVRCKTTPGSGTNFTFIPQTLNQFSTVRSNSTYAYAPSSLPVLTSISGCPVFDATSTSNCPIAGNVKLTLVGTGFCDLTNALTPCSVTVKVGTADCITPTVVPGSNNSLTCVLAAGTGSSLGVVLIMDGNFSPLNPLITVSYIGAIVASVQCTACTTSPVVNSGPPAAPALVACPANYALNTPSAVTQSTNATLTINGQNFGSSGATVFVGSQPCTNVVHVSSGQLTCLLPPGVGQEGNGAPLTVFVIPLNGALSINDPLAAAPPTITYAQCPAGYYRPLDSRTHQLNSTCTACPIGTYLSSPVGATVCTQCESGTYNAQTAQTACLPCGSGAVVPSTLGMYSVRSYSGAGATACSLCPAGSYAPIIAGSTGLGNSFCTPCPVNTFSASAGLSAVPTTGCTPCPTSPDITVNNGGATSCSQCPVGSIPTLSTPSVCQLVQVGWYGTTSSGARTSFPCSAGYVAPFAGMTSCVGCPPGTSTGSPLAGSGYATCFPCNSGFYQPLANQTACIQCPPGTARRNDGRPAITCDQCVAGTYQPGVALPAGPVVCLKCDKGSYQDSANATACLPCPDGSYNRFLGVTACTACAKGTYSVSTPQIPFTVECSLCAPGKYQDATGSSSAACKLCSPGTYQDVSGATTCKGCPPGRFTQPNQFGQSGCVACPTGQYSSNSSSTKCENCPAGQWAAIGASSCTAALPGFSVGADMSSGPTPCPPGQFSDAPFAKTCSPCQIGTYASAAASSTCFACPAGWYAETPLSASCTICSSGRYSKTNSSAGCADCDPGTYQPSNGGTACITCPIGTFAIASRSQSCTACTTGTYASIPGRNVCEKCTAGFYQPQLGATSCRACPAGTFTSSDNAPSCSPCAAGEFANVTGSQSCGKCAKGTYSVLPKLTLDSVDKSIVNLGPTSCTPCPLGSSTPADGSGSCQLCDIGRYADTAGLPACIDCAAGKHASVEGQPNCQLCPAGTSTARTASVECSPCAAGFYQPLPGSNSTTCPPCPAGSYQASQGGSVCTQCAAGKSSGGSATTCEDCSLGTFNSEPGLNECFQCEKGFFQPATGQTSCLPCPPRFSAESPRRSVCDPCRIGTYSNAYNTSECPPCAPGTYQGSNGQSICLSCSPGAWSATGATTCQQCTDPAKFSDIFGATTCTQCPTNQLANDAHTSCECQPGLFFGYPYEVYAGQPLGSTQNDYDRVAQQLAASLSAQTGRNVTIPQDCQSCPDGADCTNKGTRYLTMGTLPGWWRADNQTLTFYQCLQAEQCIGGRDSACDSYRYGPICAVCEEGALVDSGGRCTPCTNTFLVNVILTVIITLLIVLAMVIMFFLVIRSDRPQMRFVKLQQRLVHEEELAKSGVDERPFSGPALVPVTKGGNTSGVSAGFTKPAPSSPSAKASTSSDSTQVALLVDPKSELGNGGSAPAGGTAAPKVTDTKEGEYNEDGEFVTASYRPSAKPNLTYKLKIIVGFFQIATNILYNLHMPWPVMFREFINFFNFFNLDFLQWASIGCLTKINYYTHLVIATLIPIVIVILIALFYLAPYYCTHRGGSSPPAGVSKEEHKWAMDAGRKRQRRRVWKLILFTLFLVYPRVSAIVLSMYVCDTVEGVTYIESDFTQICYDSTWMTNLGWNIVCLVLYPLGVPLFFAYLLMRYRKRLSDPSVKMELGFLYDGYDKDAWYFELIDMTHKLILSALLPFVPLKAQMPVGMCVVILYMLEILLRKPYARKSDDRLHLFVQVELLLILVAGYVFQRGSDGEYGQFDDDLIGSWLIIVVCFLILTFLAQSVRIIQKMLQRTLEGTTDADTVHIDQMDDATRKRAETAMKALEKLTGKKTVKAAPRHTAKGRKPTIGGTVGGSVSGGTGVEMGALPTARDRGTSDLRDVMMTRNPVSALAADANANTTAGATVAATPAAAGAATDAAAGNTTATAAAGSPPPFVVSDPAAGAAVAAVANASNEGSTPATAAATPAAATPAAAVDQPIVMLELPASTPTVAPSDVQLDLAAVAAAPSADPSAAVATLASLPSLDPVPAATASAAPVDASAPAAAPATASVSAAPAGDATGNTTADPSAGGKKAGGHDSDSDDESHRKARRRKDSDE